MDAETLVQIATDRSAWLRKSSELRGSADILWDAAFKLIAKWPKEHQAGDPNAEVNWNTAIAHLTSAKMLYGLALETVFKAEILRRSPDAVEFRMTADGTGKVQHVERRQLGVSMGSGHDLTRLAEKAGLFMRGENSVFPADSDYKTIRAILDDLGDVVVWIGRYPVPLRSGEQRQISEGVPSLALGHYMRDWTDQVLDFYHGIPRRAEDDE